MILDVFTGFAGASACSACFETTCHLLVLAFSFGTHSSTLNKRTRGDSHADITNPSERQSQRQVPLYIGGRVNLRPLWRQRTGVSNDRTGSTAIYVTTLGEVWPHVGSDRGGGCGRLESRRTKRGSCTANVMLLLEQPRGSLCFLHDIAQAHATPAQNFRPHTHQNIPAVTPALDSVVSCITVCAADGPLSPLPARSSMADTMVSRACWCCSGLGSRIRHWGQRRHKQLLTKGRGASLRRATNT